MTNQEILERINRHILLTQKELDNLADLPHNDYQRGLCKGSILTYMYVRDLLLGEK